MKTIKNKIATIILTTIITITLILGTMSAVVTEKSTMAAIEKSLLEAAKISDLAAQNTIATYTYSVGEMATNPILSDDTAAPAEKRAFLMEKVEAYYMRDAGYVDINGNDLRIGKNVSGEDFFKASMGGQAYMSTPYISEDKKDMFIIVSVPVRKQGEISGIIYFVCDADILLGIVQNVSVGDKGSAYILDKYGRTIAYTERETVLNEENLIEELKNNTDDKELAALAAIEQKMVNGETGIDRYKDEGDYSIQSYTPIAGSDGWSIAITASETEFLSPAKTALIAQVGVSLLLCILGLIFAQKIGASITAPISASARRLQLMAEGDLQSAIPKSKAKDETKILSEGMETAISTINLYVKDIDRVMGELVEGNFDVTLSQPFIGDFREIEESIGKFLISISETFKQLNMAANQVAGGAEQMSDGAQLLAQGATEQASSVQELDAVINEISVNVRENAKHTENADEMSRLSAVAVAASNQKMQNLMEAMKDINAKSVEIGKIIKTVEDIAFQTNILALNAAVEAARAGEAGKGFAVVADEVRNLAGKSAEAAQTTTDLIEASVASINVGVKLAEETAGEILGVVDGAKATNDLITKISQATSEQAASLSQVTNGIEQILSVVQVNSATSEESAATSEELSGQAQFMKEQIGKFKFLNM